MSIVTTALADLFNRELITSAELFCLVYSFDGEITLEEWESVMDKLRTIEGATQWWIGDALLHGEKQWGSMYENAINESEARLWRIYKWVASQLYTRVYNLSWSHHREVAPLEPEEQKEFLDLAVKITGL